MSDISRQAMVLAANRMGATLLPDNDQWRYRVEIKSESSSRLYVVAQRKSNGEWGCSCPGWKSRRRCKHLTTMLPLLIQAPQRPQNVRGGR